MFKRLLGTFLFLISVFFLWKSNFPSLANGKNGAEWYLYHNSSQAVITENGLTASFACVKGEAYLLGNDVNPQRFFSDLGGTILFEETTEEGTSYYGYSPKIPYSKVLGKYLVNVHFFVGKDRAKVGFPVIYGSY